MSRVAHCLFERSTPLVVSNKQELTMPTATRDNNNKNNNKKQRKQTDKNEHQLKETTEAAFIMNK